MLDIEKNLKDDKSGAYKRELLAKFNTFELEVRSELNKGLAPNEYDQLNRLLQAVESSIAVVDQY
jgi:hypothetical protein